MKEKIAFELSRMGKLGITLALASSNDYNEANLELIRYLVNEKHEPGVYITLNKPYSTMEEILKEHEIDPRMIIFVDAITIPSGGTISNSPNCLYLSDLMNLTDMAFIIDEAIAALPSEKKFLFIDSMSTLLLYNNSGNVVKFINFLSGKIRRWKLDGVFLSLETETDKEFLSQLSLFCDKTIKLDSVKVNVPGIIS
ncbi:MAG TPA: hypothetical protein C5S51_12670 [Methanosarcinaceae archaeon]|nr:hypothetical protein [Methanosarcinaceae archaeon]